MSRICETCRHWDCSTSSALPGHEDTGRCSVNPPTTDERTGLAVWPYTESNDRCGKHDPEPAVVHAGTEGVDEFVREVRRGLLDMLKRKVVPDTDGQWARAMYDRATAITRTVLQ